MTMEQAFLDQHIPYSQEAEEAVIGAVIVNPTFFYDVASFLKAEDFFILRHQYIWQALARLIERGDNVDYVTVIQELKSLAKLEDIGGPAYLTQLINNTPTSIHAEVYGRLVERAAIRRRLLSAADRMKLLALDEELEIESVMLEAQHELDGVKEDDRERVLSGFESIDAYDQLQAELHRKVEAGEMVGYPMPKMWSKLGELIPAVYPGDFIVVSGLPGSGKSAMLEQWGEWCAGIGLLTDYIHTEMSQEQILHRRMARHSRIPYHRLTMSEGTLTDAERGRMLEADERIGRFTRKLSYRWMPDVKFEHLANTMRRDALRGVKVFLIDHFQDVQVESGRNDNTVRAYERACNWLAAFAEFRKVIVIVASQENDKGKTKWSQKLIEKALTRISIKRTELKNDYYYHLYGIEVRSFKGQKSPAASWLVTKARFGVTGKADMLNHGPCFEWVDASAVRVRRPTPEPAQHYTDALDDRATPIQ